MSLSNRRFPCGVSFAGLAHACWKEISPRNLYTIYPGHQILQLPSRMVFPMTGYRLVSGPANLDPMLETISGGGRDEWMNEWALECFSIREERKLTSKAMKIWLLLEFLPPPITSYETKNNQINEVLWIGCKIVIQKSQGALSPAASCTCEAHVVLLYTHTQVWVVWYAFFMPMGHLWVVRDPWVRCIW